MTPAHAELESALRRALTRREGEVEIRAGEVGDTFTPGVSRADFDAIVVHVGDMCNGWDIDRKWHLEIDYTAKVASGSLQQPFMVRSTTRSIEPGSEPEQKQDRRSLCTFNSVRYERIQVACVRKEKLSSELVPSARARVSHALEHVVKPFQLYVATSWVRVKVRLSVVCRGWRLDLSRVWQDPSRTRIDAMIRDRVPPHVLEVELEAVDAATASARDGTMLWLTLPPFRPISSALPPPPSPPSPPSSPSSPSTSDSSESDSESDIS